MKILLVAQHYFPEEVSGAVLATELAEELVLKGNDITFITVVPSYPKNVIFPGYKNKWLNIEIINGVKIIRTWSYITTKRGFFHRTFNFLSFSITSFFGGLKAEKPDIIFCYSPPLTLGLSAWLLSKIWKVPWVFRVEDLYPDAAVSTGLIKNKILIKLLYWLEKFLYRSASHISLISEGFKEILIKKGVSESKMSVTPVWVDPKKNFPVHTSNFRKIHNLADKFVVMYTGNMGTTSALEDILEIALLLRDNQHIKFVLIGEGNKKKSIINFIDNNNLDNILVLPYQPRENYNDVLGAADLGLVTLNTYSSSFSLPSKIFSIMASGIPVLGITPENSEIAEIIKREDCGINVEPGNTKLIAEQIVQLVEQKENREMFSKNARNAIVRKYSRDICINSFEKLLQMPICLK